MKNDAKERLLDYSKPFSGIEKYRVAIVRQSSFENFVLDLCPQLLRQAGKDHSQKEVDDSSNNSQNINNATAEST